MRFWKATSASIGAALRAASEVRIKKYYFEMDGGRVYFDQGNEGALPDSKGMCGNPAHDNYAHISLPMGGRWCTWCERSVA